MQFRYFVFSLGVISSWRRAITPGENTKERNGTNKPPYVAEVDLYSYSIKECQIRIIPAVLR